MALFVAVVQAIVPMTGNAAWMAMDKPNDKDGWIKLESAYRVLGETAKADEASIRVAKLQ